MKPASCPLIFMGTPDFAVPSLSYLVSQGFPILHIYTQPPRPRGRGYKVALSPVHLFAQEQRIPVSTPSSLKDTATQEEIKILVQKHQIQAIIVVAYGQLLPSEILEATPLGCLNLHGSLLPRWRGAAPLNRCIEAGDTHTGLTTMKMDTGLDTGPTYLDEKISIAPTETVSNLSRILAARGGPLLARTLKAILNDGLIPTAQPTVGITYAHKVTPQEAFLDFSNTAFVLEKKIRAFSPTPGARFLYQENLFKIHEAVAISSPVKDPHSIGTILDTSSLTIQCGENSLLKPTVIQKEGGRPLPIEEFQRGFAFVPFASLSRPSSPHNK